MSDPIEMHRVKKGQPGAGQFGNQVHTDPDPTLATTDFRSRTARALDDQLTALRDQRNTLMEQRREEHLLDIARKVPADVTRVIFRADIDSDGDEDILLFDSAENEHDTVTLDNDIASHLYGVAADFGTPGDFVAADWMDHEKNDDEAYYWIELDENTALGHAEDFRFHIQDQASSGAPIDRATQAGHDTWTERAMRVRAHQAGLATIVLRFGDTSRRLEVESFRDTAGTVVPFDEADNDHRFITAQAELIPYPTEAMDDHGDHIILNV